MQNLHNPEVGQKRFDFSGKKTRLQWGGLYRNQLKTKPVPRWL
jgi:hypothetical protein